MTLRQAFQPSLWWLLIVGIFLIALGYAMPDEPAGFDWGFLSKIMGFATTILLVGKTAHSWYYSNRRYDFKFATATGWKRNVVIPRSTPFIELKIGQQHT
jgi:vacuolar-type H+-ATPase subunit I/STV1